MRSTAACLRLPALFAVCLVLQGDPPFDDARAVPPDPPADGAKQAAKSSAADPPLTFSQLKELVAQAVKNRDLVFQDPEMLAQVGVRDAKVNYLFAGGFANVNDLDLEDFPVDRSVFRTQVCLELLRTRLFQNLEDRRLVAAACNRAERHLESLLSRPEQVERGGPRGIDEPLGRAQKAIWQSLYDSFAAWAEKRGERFGGFLRSPARPSKPPWDDGTPTFAPARNVASGELARLQLIGPDGVDVYMILNIKRRIYELKKTPATDWDWGEPHRLRSNRPLEVDVTVGANYYLRVCRGRASLAPFEKRIQVSDRSYTVPLPE